MVEIPRILVDVSKKPISVLGLFTEKKFLISFVLYPILISIIMGIIGAILASIEVYSVTDEGLSSLELLLLLFGYINCFVFTILSVKVLFSDEVHFSIHKPRTINIALGVSFFIAYVIGVIVSFAIFPVFSPELSIDSVISSTSGNLISDSLSRFPMAPFVSWLLGGFLVIYIILVQKVDFSSVNYQKVGYSLTYPRPQLPTSARGDLVVICARCGKQLPRRARYCNICAYPVDIPQENEISFKRVSFRKAVELLDSEAYFRGTRMDIEFECVVLEKASEEKSGGPAPYRTIQVTEPTYSVSRALYVWGDVGHRYNIELVAGLIPGDRLLVIGPRRPKDSAYYKDSKRNDVFWIERWDGTISDTGTRLLKLESVTPKKIEYSPPLEEQSLLAGKGSDVINEKKEIPTIQTDMKSPPFYCQLCSIKHAAGTPRLQCEVCGRYLCVETFADMTKAGRSTCPMCDGKLVSV